MDTFLTLVIALGGIATGIGAIWAAMVARRQARVTERTLTEQNERARLTLEYDLLSRLTDRFISSHFLSRRRAAAKYLLHTAFVDEDTGEAEPLYKNTAAMDVCAFFEELGEMERLGLLSADSVWNRAGLTGQAYWLVCKPAVEKLRQEWEDPSLFEEFEHLSRLMAQIDRERGITPLNREQQRHFMEAEAVKGEEPPTTTAENEDTHRNTTF